MRQIKPAFAKLPSAANQPKQQISVILKEIIGEMEGKGCLRWFKYNEVLEEKDY